MEIIDEWIEMTEKDYKDLEEAIKENEKNKDECKTYSSAEEMCADILTDEEV